MIRWQPARWIWSDTGYPLILLTTLLVSHHPFFWDTIQLGAKHATWFFEQQFRTLLLPADMDSGHPPLFGLYLAACWSLFGKTLLVSHLAMLPFLWGILAALQGLHRHWFPNRPDWPLVLWVFADPLIATQSILISPDILVLCGLLWTLLGWYNGSSIVQALAVVIMGMVSMRGMMVAFALFLYQCGISLARRQLTLRRFFLMLLPFIPGGVLAMAYLYWHFLKTGWWGFHGDSPWAPSFALVDAPGFLKNILVLGWRMIDQGRIWWWLFALMCLSNIKKTIWRDHAQEFIILIICLSAVLLPGMLTRAHLLAHRYLLPIFMGMHFLGYYWWTIYSPPTRKWIYTTLIIGFITGNLWIYPAALSQGWDSTLAHIPWYALRQKVIDFADKEQIPLEQIGTHFPTVGSIKYRTLSNRSDGFAPLDWQTQEFVLISNLHNEFTTEDYQKVKSDHWKLIYTDSKWPIRVDLYKSKSAAQ